MKDLLKISAITAAIAFGSTVVHANNYSASDSSTMTIDFVTAISVSVGDVTINNLVGGDTIDKDIAIIPTKDADRAATCSVDTLTLTSAGEPDITAITASVNAGCTQLSFDGTLPTNITNAKTFAGSVTVTYAYDLQTHS